MARFLLKKPAELKSEAAMKTGINNLKIINQVILSTFLSCLVLSCGQNNEINQSDDNGLKQGHWIVYGKDTPGSCYEAEQVVFDGYYKNNIKDSLWTEYYCNGNIKNVTSFSNGTLNGPYELYDSAGKIKEQGVWSNGYRIPIQFYGVGNLGGTEFKHEVSYSK